MRVCEQNELFDQERQKIDEYPQLSFIRLSALYIRLLLFFSYSSQLFI